MSDSDIPVYQNPEDKPEPPAGRTPWGLTEVAMGVFAAIFIGITIAVLYRSFIDDSGRITLPALFTGLLGGWIAYFGTAYLTARHLPGGLREQMGLRFDLRSDIPKGLLLGVLGQVMVAVVYLPLYFIDSGLVDSLDEPAKELSAAMSDWRWFVFGFFVVVISPLCEEVFFRGLTMRAIASRWGNTKGIVFSGIIFGIIHFQGLQTIALAGFGMMLAYRALRIGRIGETIIGHAVFNLITVLALVTGVS
jgi:membrane protease YdiL (CAAX protease family)